MGSSQKGLFHDFNSPGLLFSLWHMSTFTQLCLIFEVSCSSVPPKSPLCGSAMTDDPSVLAESVPVPVDDDVSADADIRVDMSEGNDNSDESRPWTTYTWDTLWFEDWSDHSWEFHKHEVHRGDYSLCMRVFWRNKNTGGRFVDEWKWAQSYSDLAVASFEIEASHRPWSPPSVTVYYRFQTEEEQLSQRVRCVHLDGGPPDSLSQASDVLLGRRLHRTNNPSPRRRSRSPKTRESRRPFQLL